MKELRMKTMQVFLCKLQFHTTTDYFPLNIYKNIPHATHRKETTSVTVCTQRLKTGRNKKT